MVRFVGAVLALSLFGAVPVAAQEEPVGDREASAARFIELSIGDNLGKSIETYVSDLIAGDADADPDQAEWAEANLPGLMLEMIDDLSGRLAPIYAQVLTQEELDALIAFYETPIGREIARKTVTLSIETEPLVQAAVEEYVGEFVTKFCARFTCADGDGGVSNPK